MSTRLLSLWKPSGRMDCIDLGEGIFLIRFLAKEDYGRALKDNPWFVSGHYLSMQNWEANFNLAKENAATIAAWVHLPNLTIEYYEPSVLQDIGKAIGPVLQIDMHTATETRGKFARLCIQISYDRPLIKLIKIGGISQPVQHKGLSSLCFSCGRVGHGGKLSLQSKNFGVACFQGSFCKSHSPSQWCDQSRLAQHHAPSKGHYRGQKSKQKTRFSARAKDRLMSSSDKEKGILRAYWTDSKSKMSMTEWRISDQAQQEFHAFIAKGSKNPIKSSGFENGTHFGKVEMSSSPTKSSLQAFKLQVQAQSGDLASAQSDTAVNISRASLKRIDPTLRAKPEARQNNEEDDSLHSDDSEDQVQADSRNGQGGDNMRCDEGSDSHLL
nr:hypothetical protein CFP56_51942 [Quercus suber]